MEVITLKKKFNGLHKCFSIIGKKWKEKLEVRKMVIAKNEEAIQERIKRISIYVQIKLKTSF